MLPFKAINNKEKKPAKIITRVKLPKSEPEHIETKLLCLNPKCNYQWKVNLNVFQFEKDGERTVRTGRWNSDKTMAEFHIIKCPVCGNKLIKFKPTDK